MAEALDGQQAGLWIVPEDMELSSLRKVMSSTTLESCTVLHGEGGTTTSRIDASYWRIGAWRIAPRKTGRLVPYKVARHANYRVRMRRWFVESDAVWAHST